MQRAWQKKWGRYRYRPHSYRRVVPPFVARRPHPAGAWRPASLRWVWQARSVGLSPALAPASGSIPLRVRVLPAQGLPVTRPVALPDGPHRCRAPADRRRVPVKQPGLHRRTSPVSKAQSKGPRGQPPLDRHSVKVFHFQIVRPSSSGAFPSFRLIETALADRVAQGAEAELIPMSMIERWTSVDKSTADRKATDPGAPAVADAVR